MEGPIKPYSLPCQVVSQLVQASGKPTRSIVALHDRANAEVAARAGLATEVEVTRLVGEHVDTGHRFFLDRSRSLHREQVTPL